MTLDWETVDRLARAGDDAGVATLLISAGEAERRAFFKTVEAGIKAVDPASLWRLQANPAGGYAIAVLGTAPTAQRASALLTRRILRDHWRWMPTAHLLAVAAARGLDWLGDLGHRLAQRLPTRDVWESSEWEFVAAVIRAGGAEPPVIEGVVRGWLAGLIGPRASRRRPVPLTTRMREDPYLDLILPSLFEIDGLGAVIFNSGWSDGSDDPATVARFPGATAALVAEGRLDRKTILAATVDRLTRGDKPNALRPFAVLHDCLAPTVDEIAEYAPDYLRMLAEGPGPLAALAQTALRILDDHGRLDLDLLLDTSAPVLIRKEKSLVKAQIAWLEKVARRDPGRVGEVTVAISGGFGHPALDIQERALAVAAGHLPVLGPETVARIAAESTLLAGDLTARAAELFGTTVAVADRPVALVAVEAAPMPAPITSAAELAEEVVVLLHDQTGLRWERVLDALVRLHADSDRESLTAALAPVLERHEAWFRDSTWNPCSPFIALGTAMFMATVPLPARDNNLLRLQMAVRAAWQEGRRGGDDSRLPTDPFGVLVLRTAEIAVHINGAMMPMLVATPTRVNGSVDPAVLLERLSRAEAEGWQPWPFDLEQALLRLPRTGVDPAVTAGAAALTSPAGRQFAQWLASGGLPDPVSEPFLQLMDANPISDAPVRRRMAVRLRPSRDGGLRLERQLLTHEPEKHPAWWPNEFDGIESVLTMVLPHHREVAAAWAIAGQATLADQNRRGNGVLLPCLAECTGPVGPGLAYALAYTLAAKQETDRASALDAFLALAAGTEPFAPAVGAALADLAADSTIKLSRVIPVLADAHRAGASGAVWEVLTAALPPLLTTKLRAVPDLLELATQIAVTGNLHAEIPGLSEAAAQPGTSRLVQESKRLHTILTTP
ncbi:DUF6493 family protein [Actinoplanes sp. G11-F43]|uniref:DUF7824 domain-containing protein n=1 Tax=Actinoplanes sp. G11-F43 TaxID=3424130 RepID=UPI003D337C95